MPTVGMTCLPVASAPLSAGKVGLSGMAGRLVWHELT